MEPNATDPLAEPLMVMLDQFERILDATSGYRARCLQAGFSEKAAEVLALEFHQILITSIVKALTA